MLLLDIFKLHDLLIYGNNRRSRTALLFQIARRRRRFFELALGALQVREHPRVLSNEGKALAKKTVEVIAKQNIKIPLDSRQRKR